MSQEDALEEIAFALVTELDTAPPDPAAATLARLASLVSDRGERVNLTGHRTPASVCEALIGDAIGVLREIEKYLGHPAAGRAVDLGSGAGFPGLPLAIARPDLQVDLVEIREKRHYFQRAVCRELGIENVRPVRARIEDHAVSPAQIVLAQAVGPIDEVVPAMHAYVSPGGIAVVPGSAELVGPADPAGFTSTVVEYLSPRLEQPRKLWIGHLPTA